MSNIIYLPYMTWADWMVELNKRKYGVNLMRTFAAGTFSLNCSFLGIPCLGWDALETQRLCFPELSVPVGDMVEARRMAKHLKNNELFYNHVSEYARKISLQLFGEETFVKNFNNIINNNSK